MNLPFKSTKGTLLPFLSGTRRGGTWGFADFAGSTLVHSTGCAAALAGAILLGPRLGRFS